MIRARKSEHVTRRLVVERERDALREENVKLRNKLLELAKKCQRCGGVGTLYRKEQRPASCPDCGHIRSVLL